MFFSVCYHH